MIEFQCPGCGHSYTVPEADAGKRAKCKSCQKQFNVPKAQILELGEAKPQPKAGSSFAKLPVPVKAALGLVVIVIVAYGIYDRMPSNREWEKANAERERLNQMIAEQRANRNAKVIEELSGGNGNVTSDVDLGLRPGEEIVLQSKDGGYVRVYPTSKDWDDAATLAGRNDEDGLQQMALQGRILSNKSGTPAKYLRSGIEAFEVRIKGGEYDLRSGWVLKEHVARLGATTPPKP